ncbi:MAG: ribose-phosphate diphosphokinase [Nanoarchaeota archaeon]
MNLGKQDDYFITPDSYRKEHQSQSLRGPMMLLSTRSGQYMTGQLEENYNRLLAAAGSQRRGIKQSPVAISTFAVGEINIDDIAESPGGRDVYVLDSTIDHTSTVKIPQAGLDALAYLKGDPACRSHAETLEGLLHTYVRSSERSVNDNWMELKLLCEAARDHGARYITAIIPCFPYARQDKEDDDKRQPISVEVMVDELKRIHVTDVITYDIHNPALRGIFKPIHLHSISPLLLWVNHYREYHGRTDVIAVAPDHGASKKTEKFAEYLGNISVAKATKLRPRQNEAVITDIQGNFEGKKRAIIFDDIVDTGGTIVSLVKKMMTDYPWLEEVHLACTHAILSGNALDRIHELREKYRLASFVWTDSVPQPSEVLAMQAEGFGHEIKLGPSLAVIVNRIHYDKSVKEATRPGLII